VIDALASVAEDVGLAGVAPE